MIPHPRRPAAGYVLLVAMLALIAMMMLVMGAIQFTGANRTSAAAKARGDQTSSCAQTAKRVLLSKFKLYEGGSVTGLPPLDVKLPDSATESSRSRVMTAHFDEANASVTIKPINAAAFGATRNQIRDLANSAPQGLTLGGQYFLAVVKCREANGREAETEFVVRFGL